MKPGNVAEIFVIFYSSEAQDVGIETIPTPSEWRQDCLNPATSQNASVLKIFEKTATFGQVVCRI